MYRSLLFILFTALSLNAFTLQNKFEYLTTDNGLSQGNVECIFQDSQGFMWFGSFNGLNRYDGYEIVVYNYEANNPNSISHAHITDICEDRNGKLWLGTFGGGVTVLDPETTKFTRIGYTIIKGDTVQLAQISAVEIDPDGNIWIMDETAGVFIYNDKQKLVRYFRPSITDSKALPVSNYFGLAFDNLGTAWLGIGNGILGKIAPNSNEVQIKVFESRVAAADDGIKSVFIDKMGNVWLGTTSQGAYKYNPGTGKFTNYRKESEEFYINGNTVMAFVEDSEGNLLIGLDGGGINVLNQVSGEISFIKYQLGDPECLSTNAVYDLFYDKSLNLWVGTYSGGINFQSPYKNKFRKYIPDPMNKNSLSYKNVTAFLQDDEGIIWIGTDGGGLNRFDMALDSFTHFRANPDNPNWLQTDVIIHLMQDMDGDIYIGSYNNGLTIFNKDNMTWKQYLHDDSDPTSLAGIHPWFCFQDSYGEIWIGLLAIGLDKFDKETGTFTHYPADKDDPTKLNSPNIKIIYEDLNMDMWIGTEGGGLHKFNRGDESFTRYVSDPNNPSSLSNDDVRAIYEDMNMRFWVGTNSGLDLMDREKGTFKTLTKADGLSGNTINGILEDNDGYLWISTDGGITKFHPDSLTFKNYDKSDGLQGNEFNYTASLISNNGNFFFGGKNGFNMFFPRDILDNPNPPKVVITSISILNKPYRTLTVKVDGKKVSKSVTTIKNLVLSHKQNILTFEFAALDFGNTQKNQYKYKLEGFDEKWIAVDASKRFATYTNLPSGDYVFQVLASNGDGIWAKVPTTIDITIKPPFWKTWWFISLIIILNLIIAYAVIKRRIRKIKEDKLALETRIQEGLREVEKQKEEVAQKDLALQQKIENEKEQNWYNVGMGRMSQVMSQNKDNLHQLSQSIISEIVEYVEVSQGAIYLINDDDETDKYLELTAAYAPDDERLRGMKVKPGEGQIGTCFTEGSVIRIDNLPEDYSLFSSGLGELALSHLAIIPLKLNEIVIGVVELLSLKSLADYKLNFVEKSGETLTSILTALKANEKTQKLLEQQRMQAEELSAQEEELRQNLEEMQATQEELARMKEAERVAEEERREAEKEFMEQLQVQNEELLIQQEAMKKEEYLFNALLNNANEYIYFKDDKSRFIRMSQSMVKMFKVRSMNDIIGKTDFDFFDDEHAQPAFDDEQKIVKSGKPMKEKIEKEVRKDGSVSYVSTTKMPLIDQDGKIVGTWGISKDVTDSKILQENAKKTQAKSSICESMFHQAINTLSGNIAVFDDKGSIFRINKQMAKSLNINPEEIENKSIFDLLSPEVVKAIKDNFKEARKKGKIEWESGSENYKLIRVFIEDIKTSYFMLINS
ncbi:MAG: PAS domain-containing protein [Bacteroidales bacterium]|nr:PAS domain-containing protein [Bacteroidales bacterium]